MNLLGIDYGEKRIGLATADTSSSIALGRGVIEDKNLEEILTHLLNIIKDEKIDRIIMGLPKRLDNTLGRQAEEVMKFVETIKLHTEIPIITWDERFTTVEAQEMTRDIPLSRKAKRKHINTVAAQLILQSYLDAQINPAPGNE